MQTQPEAVVFVQRVASAFGLGEPRVIEPLGGTATRKYALETAGGRFVVRVRPSEFAHEPMIRFDHEALERLAAHHLPVPRPQRSPEGATWIRIGGDAVEVLSWVEGEPFQQDDLAAVRDVGEFLAKFHAAISEKIPAGKEGFPREDDPDLLLPYADRLERLCTSAGQREEVERIRKQLKLVRRELDEKLWPRLPKAVIHGDIHTGNLCFRDSRVSAVYDFDYLSLQARVRDLCDALMFFAADRPQPVDPGDIRSLTAPYRLDVDRATILLQGYVEFSPLADCEWEAIPWVLRSQWCQIRLRGSRKVPEKDQLAFVLDRFFEQIHWLEESCPPLVATVQERIEAEKGAEKGSSTFLEGE